MAIIGEKRPSQKGFVSIETTEVELENRNAPAHDREVQSGRPIQSVVNELADKWWLWEIVAWSASLIGLIGVFLVLSHVDKKRVLSWEVGNAPVKFKVTINSVISILATLVKSSLLVPLAAALGQQKWLWFQGGAQKLSDFQQFDAANRGPLGSLILIWSLRGRRLACLGALIVIASLGLDFSFQQLVTYPNEEQPAQFQASMPVATTDHLIPQSNVAYTKETTYIDPSMLSAVYAGMFANDRADHLSVSPNCPTGNCTWDKPYVTLGICSKCYNITSSIRQECVPRSDNSTDASTQYEGLNCTYSLPHGLNANNLPGGVLLQVRGLQYSDSQGKTIHFTNLKNPVAMMALLNTTIDQGVLNSSFAAECALEYCVKKYNGSLSFGKFNEPLIDTSFNQSAAFDGFSTLKVEKRAMFASYLSINPPASWLADSSQVNSPSFTVGYFAHKDLRFIFDSSDTCTDPDVDKTLLPPDVNCPVTIFDGDVNAALNRAHVSSRYDIPRYIYDLDFSGIETMMRNIAHSLTSVIRNSTSTYFPTANTPLKGKANHMVTLVRVRWVWFAVPATLLVLTLVFMLLTAWETRRRKAMLWKGSSLPAFYYPLTKDGRHQLTDVASPRVMENTANTMKVKWQLTESGMRLVKVD